MIPQFIAIVAALLLIAHLVAATVHNRIEKEVKSEQETITEQLK